ncbi:hypothetical protein Pla52o_51390 [Novipirellula galeiformis]|uniref:Uncharacterized protein n=2 Tax=Novipirellula galeiformis TaxID=2528004 RepID=A0A5C6BZB4_9BACT|nr:hypothetical protein Pla52o_51390 [Novipirellula galeiformis]
MGDVALRYQDAAVETSDSTPWVWIAAAVVTVSAIIAWQVHRSAARNEHCEHSLFSELCRAHRIGNKGCKLLQSLATAASLEQPATLFLAEHHFDSALTVAKTKMKLNGDQLATIAMVRRCMFTA